MSGAEQRNFTFIDLITLKTLSNLINALSHFGVIAFRLGRSADIKMDKSDFRKKLSVLLNEVCPGKGVIWGMIESLGMEGRDKLRDQVFAGIIPHADESACMQICLILREYPAIHDMLRRENPDYSQNNLLWGIAVYPYYHYEKYQIVDNAIMAIDHAASYSSNNIACFDAVTLNIIGDKRYQEGDLEGAVKEFKAALCINPHDLNLHNSLGVCYGRMGRTAEALKEFEAAIAIDAQDSIAHFNSGQIYLAMHDRKAAMNCFTLAAEVNPEAYQALAQLGMMLMEEERYQEALDYFIRAERLKPTSNLFYRSLGKCYEGTRNHQAAIRAYKKAVRLNPGDAESLSALGYLYYAIDENIEVATVFCRHSVELSPDNGLYRFRLGRLYLKQQQLSDALKEFSLAGSLGYDASSDIEVVIGMINKQDDISGTTNRYRNFNTKQHG